MDGQERAMSTTASQLSQVTDIIMAEKSPAAQRAALEAQQAQLKRLIDGGGPHAQQAMTKLIKVDQQLLQLVKQWDDLKLQKDVLDEFEALQKVLQDQLCEMTGQTDPLLAQLTAATRVEERKD
jgi:hypothetical protein